MRSNPLDIIGIRVLYEIYFNIIIVNRERIAPTKYNIMFFFFYGLIPKTISRFSNESRHSRTTGYIINIMLTRVLLHFSTYLLMAYSC